MVDSHCHLDFPDYQGDFEAVLKRTQEALEFVVNVGVNVATSERAVELAESHSFVHAAVGIHPDEVKTVTDKSFERLDTLAKSERVVAIGECGLDYARLSDGGVVQVKQRQRDVFVTQAQLARERGLPLIMHCRDAYDDLLGVLHEVGGPRQALRGVVHCFLGNAEQAKAFLDLGLYLSFTGIITFKNASPELLRVVQETPLERMLVETDAPFLTPQPNRGKRNEPVYVVEVAKKIAELKQLPLSRVDEVTSANARALFGIR